MLVCKIDRRRSVPPKFQVRNETFYKLQFNACRRSTESGRITEGFLFVVGIGPWRDALIGGQLQLGLNHPLHIREVHLSAQHESYQLMYVSDIHLRRGRSDKLSGQILDAVLSRRADAVILGGDLADSSSVLHHLTSLVSQLSKIAPVFAIGGNHDDRVGINLVRDAVIGGGGDWIHQGFAKLEHGSRVITLSGPESKTFVDGDVRVLCAHNPRIWKTSRNQGYDLILAGHLHGCQFVAFEHRDRLYPGAIFYPYCYLNHQHGSTRLVVSRGISDLFPIRWQCPREVVLCHV